jgi:hypothetical protein
VHWPEIAKGKCLCPEPNYCKRYLNSPILKKEKRRLVYGSPSFFSDSKPGPYSFVQNSGVSGWVIDVAIIFA